MLTETAMNQSAPASLPQYLTTREVAELLRKSVSWVKHRAADNTIPHRKVGGGLRFIRKEIEAWVEGQTRGP